MKNVKKHLEANKPDRVEAFEKGAQAFAKKGMQGFIERETIAD